MAWPLASHFSAMMQNPKVAFRDPNLQSCTIEKDERNQPRPWAGAFAVVFKATAANGREPFAVRVFTTESPERRERYDLSCAYLKARRLKCLVDFEYRDRSIRSAGDGKWYPLILMEWVQGETLFKWVRARCLEGNGAAIRQIAERWAEVVTELAEASVAHGDLQHANVMVTDTGEVKLVDYDCMCVPALVGRRNLEVGVEPYQHPARNETTQLSLDLDNFSALMIYAALRALAADLSLWMKYVEQPGYDKLLFRPEDMRSPSDSPLYADLMNSPEQEVRDLAGKLFGMVQVPMSQVPPLSALANSYAQVEQHLQRQEWEAAVNLLNHRGQFRDAPARLQPLIRQAYEWVCRKQAWETFNKIPAGASEPNDRRLVEAWNEQLFAGVEAAERERLRVAEARKRVAVLDRLNLLVQQAAGSFTPSGEQKIVDMAGHLPQGYQYTLRARVEQAQRRFRAVSRLEKAVEQETSEAAIVAAWRAIVEAECENMVAPEVRPRVELAEKRAEALKVLYDIPPEVPADQRDRRIVAAWNETLLADCREADRWRPKYEQAKLRQDLVRQLGAAVTAGDDPAIAQLATDPALADYPLPERWADTVREVQRRSGRTKELLAVLADGNQAAFYAAFDSHVIRGYAEQFAPYEERLLEWTTKEVLPLDKLGLALDGDSPGVTVVSEHEATHRLRWKWPEPRFTEQCLVLVCVDPPTDDEDPERLVVLDRMPIGRGTWDDGGGSLAISVEPDWIGGYVAAYAVIDLGLKRLFSRPLLLGQLEAPPRSKWKGWKIFSKQAGGKTNEAEDAQS